MERLSTAPVTSWGSRDTNNQQCDYTHIDVISQFKNAMLDAGITPPDTVIADGALHRFKIDGKPNGAYKLHTDGRPAGYFQDFKQGIKCTWKQQSSKFMPLSEFQRLAFKEKCQREAEQRKTEEEERHNAAAKKARYIWSNANPAPIDHPYIVKKRIQPHGARLGRNNVLAIPLYNSSGELVNLQFISGTGGKRFLSGGKKKGGCLFIGDSSNSKTILIAEGFATGASLFEDTGHLTVVAFDAGNLTPVAEVIREQHPDADIIICGDNDKSGVGQKAARSAALACSGKYLIPPAEGLDFNDFVNAGGVIND